MSSILIVEDNAANLRLIRDLLEGAGHEVAVATDADSGIALARTREPSLIVMDVGLPGMDGLTATRLLKRDPTTRGIPVLALTAHAMHGDEERILAAGCDRYLAKPLRYKEFLAMTRELLGEAP